MTPTTSIAVAAAALVLMEPFVAAVHRRTMHGWAWGWHRSHHHQQRRGSDLGRSSHAFEANDLFPLVFAAATIAAMAAGSSVDGLSVLLPVGAGVTVYGGLYFVVHDLYIHGRLGRLPGAGSRYIRWVAGAHAVHHATAREPYGFLVPVVPRRTRASVPGRRGEEPAVLFSRRAESSDA
jgi:beta-carotene 3-hydroxylase